MKIDEIINDISQLPLPQIVKKHGVSWSELRGILNDYNFEGFMDYTRIDIRAPYFLDIEKAYIWGYLKACELASRKLFEMLPIRIVHESCELRLEAFRDMLDAFIEGQIKLHRD